MFRKQSQHREEQVDELLSAYLDGMLTSNEQAMLEARLRQEPALRDRLKELSLTVEALAGLPQLEVPRNFLLSSLTLAAPRPAPQPRRRRTGPVFGWATAVAALLFFLVFAADVFFVAPSLRSDPADTVAQRPGEIGLTAQPKAEEKAAVAEGEVMPASDAQVEAAGTAPPASLAGAATNEPDRAQAPPTEEQAGMAQELLGFQQVVTAAVEIGADVVITAELPVDRETPQSLELEKAVHDTEPYVTQEPEVVAVVPLEGAPATVETKDEAEAVQSWLRLLQVGLGLLVVGLTVATLVVRRHKPDGE